MYQAAVGLHGDQTRTAESGVVRNRARYYCTTVSNTTAEFSDDALQNFSRNWSDDLLIIINNNNNIIILLYYYYVAGEEEVTRWKARTEELDRTLTETWGSHEAQTKEVNILLFFVSFYLKFFNLVMCITSKYEIWIYLEIHLILN